jgi:hypothetical protein
MKAKDKKKFYQGEFVLACKSSCAADLIFVLVIHPRIGYKGNSFILGESGIEFKRNPSSPCCAMRRGPLSRTDARPSLSGGFT